MHEHLKKSRLLLLLRLKFEKYFLNQPYQRIESPRFKTVFIVDRLLIDTQMKTVCIENKTIQLIPAQTKIAKFSERLTL